MLISTNYVSFAYYKLRQSVVTNYDSFFYYKLSFYKLRHVFQITAKLEIRFRKNLAKLTGSAVRINSKMPKGKIIRRALAREARAAELHG